MSSSEKVPLFFASEFTRSLCILSLSGINLNFANHGW